MATDRPSRRSATRPGSPASARPGAGRRLGHRVRLLLDRHVPPRVDPDADRQGLRVVGLGDTRSDELRHSLVRHEDALLGLTVAQRYWAVAVVAPSVVTIRGPRRHDDGSLAIGVCRAGRVVSFVATTASGVIETHDPKGWLVDACRRALGLATEPCPAHPLDLLLALWLDRIMISMVGAPPGAPRLTWGEVVGLCPTPWPSTEPVELGTILGTTSGTWAAMRRAAIEGRPVPIAVEAAWARWMDDAMFARWCLGYFPDLESLRADVEFLAPSSVAENLELAVQAARSVAE